MKKLDARGFSVGILLIVIIILGAIASIGFYVKDRTKVDTQVSTSTDLPQFMQHDFIDPSVIYSVSKFRSAEGHDFSSGNETCRSMKHYFNQQYDMDFAERTGRNGGITPPPDGKTDIDIFSPVDGTISQIASERLPIGEQFYIVPDSAKDYTIRLFHVYKADGITKGSHVSAGQKIGVIAKGQTIDVSVERKGGYVSYFDVMPDYLFKAYQDRGAQSRQEFVITKDYRDAHPVPCHEGKTSDQRFEYPADYDHDADIVKLSGYQAPTYPTHNEQSNQNQQKNQSQNSQ